MNKSEFYYDLPQNLIAQTPIYPRDSSKMLVYDRRNKEISDKHFYDVIDYLKSGDVLVINNTRVLPARILGQKATGSKIEILLSKRKEYDLWEVLAKPAKRLRIGDEIVFSDKLKAIVTARGDEGIRELRFVFDGIFEEILLGLGEMPLPHYIHEKLSDQERYQTVYSKVEGSSAAPTAGLHFTPELMDKIRARGVIIAEVLLHVGLGTFRPVKTEKITDHKMHSEIYEVSENAAEIINRAKREARRVIAVGTTSVRVLESATGEDGLLKVGGGETSIFIYPPYKFRSVDALITNFHLPESTLIMLVSAFMGREEALGMYRHAVENEYRFFSFGDSCLIL
ncbi:MAG: tRNA preQ1(34) S-adenosylmethionine ribosyltransferase-isomerase QueA [Clostridia bacterium]|nr:tRNA preQ1(34) S-adenosylmethionine ribosyltransferase-isomerase QueA [Clostridia bacterium]